MHFEQPNIFPYGLTLWLLPEHQLPLIKHVTLNGCKLVVFIRQSQVVASTLQCKHLSLLLSHLSITIINIYNKMVLFSFAVIWLHQFYPHGCKWVVFTFRSQMVEDRRWARVPVTITVTVRVSGWQPQGFKHFTWTGRSSAEAGNISRETRIAQKYIIGC